MSSLPTPIIALLLRVFFLQGMRSQNIRYSVDEEAPPGTVLGVLAEDLQRRVPLVEPVPGSFHLVKPPGNGSLVRVRERDGQLSLGFEQLDREQLCGPAKAPCLLAFDVLSLGGPSASPFRLIHVELEVRDINDNAPRFPQPSLALEVSESAAPGTRLPLPLAHDPDVGSNGLQSFALSPGSPFGLEAQSRADGLKCAELVLLRQLDREAQDGYRLELVAKDGGNPARSGTATLSVRVLDANDNAPAFSRGALLTLELPEDAPQGALLLDLDAADPDEGANGQLLYAWGSQVAPEARQLFSLDPLSGRLSLRAAVDYELQRTYELDVQVSDRGASPLAASCKVVVRLLDVNDNAPAVAISALSSAAVEGPGGPGEAAAASPVAYVSEAAPAQSLVALVSTSDNDAGANGQVRCTLLAAAPHQPFTLQRAYDAASYLVLTTGALDRERLAEYNLTLVAEDLGSPPAKTVRHLTVRLADENDNAPRFAKARYEVSLLENNPPGAYLDTVVASDPDLGPNGKVTYRLPEAANPLGLFSVDPRFGVLRVQRLLDHEELSLGAEVRVEACDGGTRPLCGGTLVALTVEDQNDNPPELVWPPLVNGSADLPLPLGAPPGFRIARLAARDADGEGPNSELTFSLLEGRRRLFAIHPLSGELFLRERLPRGAVTDSAFHLLVAVEDGGRPPLTSSATLRLICTETLPSGVPIVGLQLRAADGEDPWDVSLVLIAVLASGCGIVLVAILMVGASIYVSRKKAAIGRSPMPERCTGGRNIISADSALNAAVSRQVEEGTNDSLGVAEPEASCSDSQSQVLIPFEPVTEWVECQSASSFSCSGPDQDSGRGESECYHSDLEVGRKGKNEATAEKWEKQNDLIQRQNKQKLRFLPEATAFIDRTSCRDSNNYNVHSLGKSLLRCTPPYPAAQVNRHLGQRRNTHCHFEFLTQSKKCPAALNETLPKIYEQVSPSGKKLTISSRECREFEKPLHTSESVTAFLTKQK